MKIVNLERPPYLRLFVYGDTGSGKTMLAGSAMTCPKTCPVLVLNARGQPVSLRHFDPPPLVIEMETMKDFNAPYNWIKAGQPTVIAAAFPMAANAYLQKHGFEKFQTVVIDSVTHTQRVSMAGIVPSPRGLPGPGDLPTQAQIQHWGATLRQMVNLSDLYFKLPVHVIVTALAKWTALEGMGAPMFTPFLWGQGSQEVPSHAEVVGRLVNLESLSMSKTDVLQKTSPEQYKGAYNILLLRGGRNFVAKWQGIISPPEYILGPTIQKMVDQLQEGGAS
jgi:hypothetical protein